MTKSLKKNQTADPCGMINELFIPCVMGCDLKSAILSLVNGVKNNGYLPPFMEMADVCTIYKQKGSHLKMSNDRGIFILTILRKLCDKLVYSDDLDFSDLFVHLK